MPGTVHDHEFHEINRTQWSAQKSDDVEVRYVTYVFQCSICALTQQVHERDDA